MKLFVLPLLAALLFFCPLQAFAEAPVSIILYKADAKAPNGFREEFRWRMNQTDEWRRFEYVMTGMPVGTKETISPYLKKPAEMLVLSVKNENGITGKDYYLSPDGIMLTAISGKNRYFFDTHKFAAFLKDELKLRASFEKFPGEKIPTTAPGVVARYRINDTLPNPTWNVNVQKDVNLYDSFLRDIPVQSQSEVDYLLRNHFFEDKGNFIVLLNYPKAPAKYATVGTSGIRLSDAISTDTFFKDEQNYFKFFYDLTQESMKTTSEVLQKEKTIREKGQF